MTPHQPSDWKDLAEQASEEMDPKRLMYLVDELNRVLGDREAASHQRQSFRMPVIQDETHPAAV